MLEKICNFDPKASEPIDNVPRNWANTSVGTTIGTLTQSKVKYGWKVRVGTHKVSGR